MTDKKLTRRQSVADLLSKQSVSGDTELLPWQMPGPYGPLPVATSHLRGSVNALGVHTDGAAVAVWLADRADRSVNTAQSYRKEAERLLLWASEVKGMALCQLERAEFLEFRHFLRNAPDDWIMDQRYKRKDPRWRPFLQQPSDATIAYTLSVLYGMMKYLTKAGWFVSNPMPENSGQIKTVWRPTERALPPELVEYLFKATAPTEKGTIKEKITQARDRWLITFMLYLAPRVSETKTDTGTIKRQMIGTRSAWVWHVTGKGGYDDRVPVPTHVMDALAALRVSLGLPPMPVKDDPIPLIPTVSRINKQGLVLNMPKPMTRNAIYKRLTDHIFPAAAALAAQDGLDGSLLLEASPHWLRHTGLTQIARSTGNLKIAQTLGRHRSINTTSGYVQTDQGELLAALEDARQR